MVAASPKFLTHWLLITYTLLHVQIFKEALKLSKDPNTNSRRSFETLVMRAILPTIHLHHPTPNGYKSQNLARCPISATQGIAVDPRHLWPIQSLHLPQQLSNLIHLHLGTTGLPLPRDIDGQMVSTTPIKEDIATKWHEIHSSSDWTHLIDPLRPWLRQEILKYGEFAQATYDAFDFDSFSEYCGSCRYNQQRLFEQLGLSKHGYKVTKYIHAMSHIDLPRLMERSHLLDAWSKDSNWMGYIAVSDDDESCRIGRRDIVVAWRGTVAPLEWYEDLQRKLEPIGDDDVRVEHGFHSIYTSKCESTRYNKSSASEQVMGEVRKLVNLYKQMGEEVGVTITGHSLGGALALLNAYEVASSLPDLPISVISFGTPRVGNNAFRDKLNQMQVKILRVVIKQDVVPMMPGIIFNEHLEIFEEITGTLDWVYTHVGTELKLDTRSSPYLQHRFNVPGTHSLETYLHLVDGFDSSVTGFRKDAQRDVALVNKACGMLVNELKIPECWYQQANKGLVRNSSGRWVQPKRDIEDIPSPCREDSYVLSLN